MAELRPLEAAVTTMSDLPLRRFGRPIGRDDLLRALLLRLRQNQPLVLHGASGIGKTTIAATIANVYAQQPEQSVLWLPVDEPPLVELLVRISRAYGALDVCNASNPLAKRAAVAGLLRQHQPLIVLDGRVDESVLNQFYDDCGGDLPLVVTSEKALAGGAWRNQAIGNLSEDDALLLFKQKAGIEDSGADSMAAAIVAQLNNEAFPVVLAARSMIISRQTPEDYHASLAALLEEHEGQADSAALAASVDALNPRLRELLGQLGATPRGEASISFLRLLSDMPVSAIDQSMTILSRLFLIERFERLDETCYRMHPLVHGFLQSRSAEEDRLDDLREDVKTAVSNYLAAHNDGPDALIRLVSELDNLIATAAWAADNDDRDLAGRIVGALSSVDGLVYEAGYAYELALLESLRDGIELEFDEDLIAEPETDEDQAVERVEDAPGGEEDETESLAEVEDVEVEDGVDESTRPAAAPAADDSTFISIDDEELQSVNIDQLRTALLVASQNNETDRQLRILKAIAKVQINQGRDNEAASTYAEVLEIYETSADKDGVLETLDALAGLLVSSESAPSVLEQVKLRTALTLARQHEDTARVLQILDGIGKVQIEQKRENDAVATFNEVLEIHEAEEDKAGILGTLDMLAGLLVRTDAAVTALNHIQRGLHLAEELADRETEMFLRTTLGDAHRALGEAVTAIENYEMALTISRDRDDQQNEAHVLYKLGMAQLDAGDTRQAIEMLEGANELFKEQSKRDMEGLVLRGLGEINVELERWSEAVNFHTSALYIAREIQDKEGEAGQLRMLGKVLIQAERLPEALTHYRQALHVAYECEDAANIVGVIGELVNLMMRNQFLASISELLVNDGLAYDPDDRELLRLKSEVTSAKEIAAERGVALAVVAGTAREYAANAYNYS
ncbi:MAG: tetratricopeptide repeat protein [Chloroflexi bacterium]|nr:tetratricopeptide repeat protein [Chloroflexota bacterium]